jgi:hypothetical protein
MLSLLPVFGCARIYNLRAMLSGVVIMDRGCLLLGSHLFQLFLSCFKYGYFLSVGLSLSEFLGVTGHQSERPSTLHQVMRNKIPSAVLLNECRY